MLGNGFRAGRYFGVEVRIDWSLFIIFTLVVVNLGMGVLRAWHPSWTSVTIWSVAFATAVLFFVSVLLHEMSHALVARRLGVGVDRITLFIFGGMAHMKDEPNRPRSEFLIAVVGPLMSIAIAVAAFVGVGLLAGDQLALAAPATIGEVFDDLGPVATILLWLGQVNLLLAIFNLVPGFPLDGGRVLRSALWAATKDLEKATRWASNAGRAFAFVLIGYGVILIFRGAIGQGFWLMLIGWFLNSAAIMSYQQLTHRRALEGVRVREVMSRDLASVSPSSTVDALVRDHLMATDQRAFPVLDEQRNLLGLVCLEDVRRAPRERWPEITVHEIMTPREKLVTMKPDEDAERALRLFAEAGVDQLPVLDGDNLVGFVRRGTLLRWIALTSDDKRPRRQTLVARHA